MYIIFWLGRDLFKGIGVEGKIILKWILMKQGGRVWTGFIQLRVGKNDGLL
jgi:hypothetical protein